MSPDSTSITPAQASLMVEQMRQQAQMASASIINGTPQSDSTTSTQDFTSLLDSIMNSPTAATNLTQTDQMAPLSLGNAPDNATGSRIAQTATQLAGDLQGSNNRWYDTVHTPQVAQQVWNTSGWGNGNVQCVAFVAGAYQQAGITLPSLSNATDFFANYTNRPGWSAIPNGQGLPKAGDIIAMSGGGQGYGHVAIVTSVIPPQDGKAGSLTIAQSNAPTSQTTLPIASNGQVIAWSGYPIQGFIRPATV